MKCEILRLEDTGSETLGLLFMDGEIECYTLERSWRDNEPDVSRVPPGDYVCGRTNSPKFGDAFEVLEVPDRSRILFHIGNTKNETLGCVLLGRRLGYLYAKRAVLESGLAFGDFMKKTEDVDRFDLRIVDYLWRR